MKVREATQLKIDLMWEHIGKIEPEKERSTLRANMLHTFEKLLNFLDVDFGKLQRKADKLDEVKANGDWSDRCWRHEKRSRMLHEALLKHMFSLCPTGWSIELDYTVIGAETEDRPLGFRIVCHNGTDDNLTVEHKDFHVAVLDMIRLFMLGHLYPLA
jgi:hypothetical protein